MNDIFGPSYLFFQGDKCPPYVLRPYLRDVRVAAVLTAPENMKLEVAMLLLRTGV